MNDQSGTVTPAQGAPEEHGTRLRKQLAVAGTAAGYGSPASRLVTCCHFLDTVAAFVEPCQDRRGIGGLWGYQRVVKGQERTEGRDHEEHAGNVRFG